MRRIGINPSLSLCTCPPACCLECLLNSKRLRSAPPCKPVPLHASSIRPRVGLHTSLPAPPCERKLSWVVESGREAGQVRGWQRRGPQASPRSRLDRTQTPAPAPRPGASRCGSGTSCAWPREAFGWVGWWMGASGAPLASATRTVVAQGCAAGRHPTNSPCAVCLYGAPALTRRPGWWPQSAAPSRSQLAQLLCLAAAASA